MGSSRRANKNPKTARSGKSNAAIGFNSQSLNKVIECPNCKAKNAFWRAAAHWHFPIIGEGQVRQ